jgi:hypothetical protein
MRVAPRYVSIYGYKRGGVDLEMCVNPVTSKESSRMRDTLFLSAPGAVDGEELDRAAILVEARPSRRTTLVPQGMRRRFVIGFPCKRADEKATIRGEVEQTTPTIGCAFHQQAWLGRRRYALSVGVVKPNSRDSRRAIAR